MKYRIVYSVLLIGFLSACGRAPQTTVTVPEPNVGDVPLTQQYVEENLKDYSLWLANTVVNSIRSSGFETPAALMAQQAGAACGFEGIAVVNTDDDSVPKDFTTKFENCFQDKDTYIEIKNGEFHIEDVNDNDPIKGPRSGVTSRATDLTFDFYTRNGDGSQGEPQLTLKDTWNFTIGTVGDMGAMNYRLTMVATKPGIRSIKGVLELAGEYAINGDGDRNDFDKAAITGAAGELVIDNKAKFKASVDNLAFVEDCPATPTDGSLSLSDGNNTLTLEFSGCEQVLYSYNGNPLFAPAE